MSISFTTLISEDADSRPITPPELGFGSDISCGADLDPLMVEVDPFSTRALGEAIVRRLDCPRGRLIDDPNYGIDLRSYFNHGTTAADIRAMASKIRAELQKDDRIHSVVVTVTPSTDASELGIDLRVTPVDPSLGVFSLTLIVTDSEVLLAEMRA